MSEWEQVLLSCQTSLKSNTSRLPDTNIYQLKLLDLAMDACINLGLWEEALHYGNRTLQPYRWELALLWFMAGICFHPRWWDTMYIFCDSFPHRSCKKLLCRYNKAICTGTFFILKTENKIFYMHRTKETVLHLLTIMLYRVRKPISFHHQHHPGPRSSLIITASLYFAL